MKIVYDIEVYAKDEDFQNKKTAKELIPYVIQCAYKYKDHHGVVREKFFYFRNYDDFFAKLVRIGGKNHTVYSFNGANYENYFLLKYLIRDKKYKFVDKVKNDGEFSAIITDAKKTLYLELQLNGKKFKFIDVMISLSIQTSYQGWIKERLGITLSKDGIDHKKPHYPDTVLTEKEIEYIKDDVIPFLNALDTYDKEQLKAITFQSYGIKQLIKASIYQKSNNEKYRYENFRQIFPVLDLEEASLLRGRGIHGGISGTNPKWAGRKVYQAIKMDIHSSYPSRHINNLVPKGKGVYATYNGLVYRSMARYNNYCYIARIKYKIGDTVNFPFFVGEIEPSNKIKLDVLYLSPDRHELDNFKKCYPNGEIEIIDGYFYKLIVSPFKKQVLVYYNEKQAGDKKSKLLLNACSYGKFAERSHEYNIRIDEKMEYYKKELKELKRARYEYLPLALCITQLSRNQLVETAYEIGFDNVIQYDTDSLIFYTAGLRVDLNKFIGKEIGAWGLEKQYYLFKGLWSKHYMGVGYDFKKNKITYDGACAGYHIKKYNIKLFKRFNNDFTIKQLQSNKSYDFGVYLLEAVKTFKKQNEVDERIDKKDERYINLMYVKQRQYSLQQK